MSPDTSPAVRELLETRLDSVDHSIKELSRELRQGQERIEKDFGNRLDRIEVQVTKTNGRVTRMELEEAAAKAVAEDHRRMAALQENRSRQWVGIVPAVIAGTCSGIAILLVTLLITGQI